MRLLEKGADLFIRFIRQSKRPPNKSVPFNYAIALSVSADVLLFDKDERGPDDDRRLQFEAVQHFTPEEKQVTKTVLEGLILKHDANRFNRAS